MPRRGLPSPISVTLRHLELTRAIIFHGFPADIRHRHGLTAYFIPDLKLMLLLSYFSYAYREFTRLIPNDALNHQAVSQVIVRTLVERA